MNAGPRKTRPLYLQPNLLIIYSVTLIAILGVSSLTPALPIIVEGLGISPEQVGLLITFFTLPGVLLTPVLGILADRYGRKRVLVPSLFLFAAGGCACFFARDFGELLWLRVIQGTGAASLGALNVTLLGDLYSGRERRSAMGYNASVLSVGAASFPAIGGALAVLGWNYPFLLSSFALPVGLLVLFGLNNPDQKNTQPLKEYISEGWRGMTDKRVIGLFLVSMMTFVILFGSFLTFFPLLMREVFGADPLMIGLFLTGLALSMGVTASQLGRLSGRYSEAGMIRTAFVLYALALIMIPSVEFLPLMLLPIALFGVAMGINVPSIQVLLAELTKAEHRALFMSVNGMVLRAGQALGPLVMGAAFIFRGMDWVFYAGVMLSVVMFFVSLIMIR